MNKYIILFFFILINYSLVEAQSRNYIVEKYEDGNQKIYQKNRILSDPNYYQINSNSVVNRDLFQPLPESDILKLNDCIIKAFSPERYQYLSNNNQIFSLKLYYDYTGKIKEVRYNIPHYSTLLTVNDFILIDKQLKQLSIFANVEYCQDCNYLASGRIWSFKKNKYYNDDAYENEKCNSSSANYNEGLCELSQYDPNSPNYNTTLAEQSCDFTSGNYDCIQCYRQLTTNGSVNYNADIYHVWELIDDNPVGAFNYFLVMTGYDRWVDYNVTYDATKEEMFTVESEMYSGSANITIGKDFNSSYYIGTLIRKMYFAIMDADAYAEGLYDWAYSSDYAMEFKLRYWTLYDHSEWPQGSVSWTKNWAQGAKSLYEVDLNSQGQSECSEEYNEIVDLYMEIYSISDSNCY